MTPREIDEYVRSQLGAGADLYTLHAEALAGLAPDLILTQDLCRVCALPSGPDPPRGQRIKNSRRARAPRGTP